MGRIAVDRDTVDTERRPNKGLDRVHTSAPLLHGALELLRPLHQ